MNEKQHKPSDSLKIRQENKKKRDEEIENSEMDKYDFKRVKKHLSNLETVEEKLICLINLRADYLQQKENIPRGDWYKPEFNELCDAEINKLKELKELKLNKTKGIKHSDLRLDRAVLLMHYIFKAAKVNCHNTKKAKVINFLTGFSENTSGDKFSALYSKSEKNFVDFEKDVEIVNSYLKMLGLTEMVEVLNKDVEDFQDD